MKLQSFGARWEHINAPKFSRHRGWWLPRYEGENMSDKPVLKVRSGSVQGSVWKNEGEKDGKKWESFSVTLQRSYKDGEEWKNTSNLRIQDLADARAVLDEIFSRQRVTCE